MAQRPLDVTREIDRLYALPLGEFTAGRDALLARVRALGAREAAEHIRRLRRPTLAAHMLNRVARERPPLVEAVLAAGAHLRREHEALLAGRPADIPAADAALLAAIAVAVDAAREASADSGGGVALADRLRATLRAAALDEEVGDALRAGRLDRDHSPVVAAIPGVRAAVPAGAGTVTPVAVPAPAPAPSPPDPEVLERLAAVRAELDAAVAALHGAETAEDEAVREADGAADRRAAAERDADEARARAEEARRAADAAAAEAADAEERLSAAVAAAADAEARLRDAREEVDAARARRDAARAEAERILR